jgi:2-phospho-L-lactate guanylyltransferase (CobY/MobA/RfbA family)
MVARSEDLVIAPDEAGTGTNALLLRTAALRRLSFAYGKGSFSTHVTAAREFSLSVGILNHWRLAFDLDEPQQYLRWAHQYVVRNLVGVV